MAAAIKPPTSATSREVLSEARTTGQALTPRVNSSLPIGRTPGNEIPHRKRLRMTRRSHRDLRRFLEPDGIGPRFAPGMVTDDDAGVRAGPGAEIELGLGDSLLADGLVLRGSADEEDPVDR